MGLKDLFKPKWQYSDPHVRARAIAELNDDALLTEIILNDLDENVRRAALKKLHETVKHTNISKDFHWTKKHENFLKRIAVQDSSEIVRLEAISGVNDIISDKKREDGGRRKRYKDSKEDQDLLVDIARNDASRHVRLKSMENLRDQLALLSIAQEDDDSEVRKAAADLLWDEDLLKEIAEHGKHEDARIAVINNHRIDDKLRTHIACKDNNPTVREEAVRALRDLNHVRNLAQTSIHPEVRSAAESILSEQKILAVKALSAPSGERWNAVRDLRELNVLKIVAAKEKDRDVLKLAVEKLTAYVEKTTDQPALVDIAKSESIEVVRSTAITKIEDEKLKKALSIQLLREAVENFRNEKNFDRRVYLSDAIAQCSSEETISFLGEAMRYEVTVYKNYGEPPRKRLVRRYEEIVGKKFSKKRFKNQYGANCDDGGLLAALDDYKIRSGSGRTNTEKESQGLKVLSPDLIKAIEEGRLDIVKDLIDKGTDVNGKTKDDYTALMRAAQEGHTEIVQLLLERGAHIEAKLKSGQNALITAVALGHARTVQALLDKGADVDSQFSDGETALMVASKEGYDKVVQILLDYGANVNVPRQNGWTALMGAAYRGRAEIARLLLEKGADVNARDEASCTPLIAALVGSNLIAVPVLLEYGADANAVDEKGNPALVLAADVGDTDTVKSLLAKGANVNAKDECGNTALLSAVRYEHCSMAKVLLEKGADVNVKNSKGQTPMKIASNLHSSKDKTDIINTLKMHGGQ